MTANGPATLAETEDLKALAEEHDAVLFAAWHSRFAPGISRAQNWLSSKTVTAVAIDWHEDVRVWHPGQDWIWEAGGMGVFDPGINALSIATQLVSTPFFLKHADLEVPENCQTPIAARLGFRTAAGIPVDADFDFRHQDPPSWDMRIDTDAGVLKLESGGSRLIIDGEVVIDEPEREYQGVYAHFCELLKAEGEAAGWDAKEAEQEGQVAGFVSALFLTHRGYTDIWQLEQPNGDIFLQDKWPGDSDFESITEKLDVRLTEVTA